MNSVRPSITIIACNADPFAVKEVTAGMEEEGALFDLEEGQGEAGELAAMAGERSVLKCGVGIHNKICCLMFPGVNPGEIKTAMEGGYRVLGQNAARVVKKLPLMNILSY